MQKQLCTVLETTRQDSESSSKEWIETSIWTRNMLTALDNGVKGGKWFSLIDKVYSLKTLNIAWEQVKSNKGSAGIDKVSIEKFEHKAQTYLEELEQSLKEQSYFDTIPHSNLMRLLEERISDKSLLNLINKYLKQNIIDGVKNWIPIAGTPQGAVISPLLANIYLHPMDVMLTNLGLKVVRYADDFVILSKTEQEAKMALEKVREWVDEFGLTLHPNKTHIGNASIKGQGFEFLGYRFEAGKRFVRKKSLKSFRDKVRAKTKRSRSGSINEIIADLNPMLRGWFEYFKHAYKSTFNSNDGFVRRRLRAILLKIPKYLFRKTWAFH